MGVGIKEAIWIRKIAPSVNTDEEATDYVRCGTVWSPRHLANSKEAVPDEGHRWWLKRRCESIFMRCEIRKTLHRDMFHQIYILILPLLFSFFC